MNFLERMKKKIRKSTGQAEPFKRKSKGEEVEAKESKEASIEEQNEAMRKYYRMKELEKKAKKKR